MQQVADNSKIATPSDVDFYATSTDGAGLVLDENGDKTDISSEEVRKKQFYYENPPLGESFLGYDSTNEVHAIRIDPSTALNSFSDIMTTMGQINGNEIVFPVGSLSYKEDKTTKAFLDSVHQKGIDKMMSSILNSSDKEAIEQASSLIKERYIKVKLTPISIESPSKWAIYCPRAFFDETQVKKLLPEEAAQDRANYIYSDILFGRNKARAKDSTEPISFIQMSDKRYYEVVYSSNQNEDVYILEKNGTVNAKDNSGVNKLSETISAIQKDIKEATDIILVSNNTAINRADGTMYQMNYFGSSIYNNKIDPKEQLDSVLDFFANSGSYTNYSFSLQGTNRQGNILGVIYIKDKAGLWYNLNKKLIACYGAQVDPSEKFFSTILQSWTYNFEKFKYADILYSEVEDKDDRLKIQQEIYGYPFNTLNLYRVTIGDCTFCIPPIAIKHISQTTSERMPMLRARGSAAKTPQKIKKILNLTLFFSDSSGINGVPKEFSLNTGEKIVYHMNGLRALLAQFMFTPFVPIDNDYINKVLKIDAVSFSNISINTVEGYPRLLQVSLDLREFEYRIFMPEIPVDDEKYSLDINTVSEKREYKNYFAKMFSWDVMRYYYQKCIRLGEELKNLDFNSDEYNQKSFGRKALVPADFNDCTMKFYIPNEEHLEEKLQAKMEAMRYPYGYTHFLSETETKLADYLGSIGKAANEAAMTDDFIKALDELNAIVKGSDKIYTDGIIAYSDSLLGQDADEAAGNDEYYVVTADNILGNTEIYPAIKKVLDILIKQVEGVTLPENKSKKVLEDCRQVLKVSETEDDRYILKLGILGKVRSEITTGTTSTQTLKEEASRFIEEKKVVFYKHNYVFIPISMEVRKGASTETLEPQYYTIDQSSFIFDGTGDPEIKFLNFCYKISQQNTNKTAVNLKKNVEQETFESIKFDEFEVNDVIIESFSASLGNNYSDLSLSSYTGYATQYVGGQDVSININFVTTNKTSAMRLSMLPEIATRIAKSYKLVLPAYPLKINSQISRLVGVDEVSIEACQTNTVPGYPGLYRISMSFLSMNRTLKNKEIMRRTQLNNFTYLTPQQIVETQRDTFFEINNMLSKADLYPDLEIPTLEEFRKAGFEFLRHRMQVRTYPDPDFYFLYPYQKTSEIIREAVRTMVGKSSENSEDFVIANDFGESATVNFEGDISEQIQEQNPEAEAAKTAVEAKAIEQTTKAAATYKSDGLSNVEQKLGYNYFTDTKELSCSWKVSDNIIGVFLEKSYWKYLSEAKQKVSTSEDSAGAETETEKTDSTLEDLVANNKVIEVHGGDLSGNREPNVAVNIGFGDRDYWAYTNKYGQLVKVVAKEIILQNNKTEPVNSNGRYYSDEAKVPGTEFKGLDEGHVIADSLGGVSNAYNITPQGSTVNQEGGEQFEMEQLIKFAGGCTDFVATITYPDTKTQIPSHYSYTFNLNGEIISKEFDNVYEKGDVETAGKVEIHPDEINDKVYKYKCDIINTINEVLSTSLEESIKKSQRWTDIEDISDPNKRVEYISNLGFKPDSIYENSTSYHNFNNEFMSIESNEIEYIPTDLQTTPLHNALIKCLGHVPLGKFIYAVACARTAISEYAKDEELWWPQKLGFEKFTKGIEEKEFGIFRMRKYSKADYLRYKINHFYQDYAYTDKPSLEERIKTIVGMSRKEFVLDDYYATKASDEELSVYYTGCVTSPKYAAVAFMRNLLFYYRELVIMEVLPSFGYDIAQNEVQIANYSTESMRKVFGDNMSEANITAYKSFMEKNFSAIKNGKLFILSAFAATDGSNALLTLFRNRDYNALNTIINSAKITTSVKNASPEESDMQMTLRRFVRALCGLEVIDGFDGLGQQPSVLPAQKMKIDELEEMYCAAMKDPQIYLRDSFYDMVVHDGRGRMVRAFPTFYMIFIDEGRTIGSWKLHDNFYNTNSLTEIQITKSRKNPTDVARIMMTNFFRTFSSDDEDLNIRYETNWDDIWDSGWYPNLRKYAERQEYKRQNTPEPTKMRIRPGARIQVRMGYGGNAAELPIQLNGYVTEVSTGDHIELIAQSDGVELSQPLLEEIFADEVAHTDSSFWEKPFFDSDKTPKTIINHLLTSKGGSINKWLVDNADRSGFREFLYLLGDKIGTSYNRFGLIHFGSREFTEIFEAGEICQNIFEGPTGDELLSFNSLEDIDDVNAKQLSFSVFGKTIWECLHICRSICPDYITSVAPFGFRSTIFFGKPHYYYAYDYYDNKGSILEKRKPFQQYHIYNSLTDIIANNIKASADKVRTCAIGVYQVDGTFNDAVTKKTPPIFVDREIYPEFQKTMTYDTKLYGRSQVPGLGKSILMGAGAGAMFGGIAGAVVGGVGAAVTNTVGRLINEVADEYIPAGITRTHADNAAIMTMSGLRESVKEMYQGELIVIGDPTVKPYDRIFLKDLEEHMEGQVEVREIVQNFSCYNGYTTSIYVDCIVAIDPKMETRKQYDFGRTAQAGCISALATSGRVGSVLKQYADQGLSTQEVVKKAATESKNGLVRAGQWLIRNVMTKHPIGSMIFFSATIGGYFLTDYISKQLRYSRCCTVFPLRKNEKVLTAGLDGSQGLIVGSPTEKSQGIFRTLMSKAVLTADTIDILGLLDKTGVKSYAEGVLENDIWKNASQEEKTRIKMLGIMSNSNLEYYGNIGYLNPYIPRITAKSDKRTLAEAYKNILIKGIDISAEANNVSRESLMPICADNILKEYISKGFFQTYHEHVKTKDGHTKESRAVRIRNQDHQVSVIVREKDANGQAIDIDFPLLSKDALGVLIRIVKTMYDRTIASADQSIDPIYYNDTYATSQVLLLSALQLKVSNENVEKDGKIQVGLGGRRSGNYFELSFLGKCTSYWAQVIDEIQKDLTGKYNDVEFKVINHIKKKDKNMCSVMVYPKIK